MSRIWLLLLLWALPISAQAQLRLASYNIGLGRDGPGLLLKDIIDRDEDILARAEIIATLGPDILLLTGFDNDYQNLALSAFNALPGLEYPYFYAPLGNAGLDSGLDITGNGRLRDWNDNWGFGRFEGAEGMVLLSRYPIAGARQFDRLKWRDFGPAPLAPDGAAFYPDTIWQQLRLAAHSLWDIEITLPSGPLRLLAAHPTPPVFDGDEDANGLRNEAEINFLIRYLNGEAFTDDSGITAPLPDGPVVLLADLNADPVDGESRKQALSALLAHPRLQDPEPRGENGSTDTVAWESAGELRVDYVLPGAGLLVLDAGVFWPLENALLEAAQTAHRLVWVDIMLPLR